MDSCVLHGQSARNQQIERWWGYLQTQNVDYSRDLFLEFPSVGEFNGDMVDMGLVQFCFLKVIQVTSPPHTHSPLTHSPTLSCTNIKCVFSRVLQCMERSWLGWCGTQIKANLKMWELCLCMGFVLQEELDVAVQVGNNLRIRPNRDGLDLYHCKPFIMYNAQELYDPVTVINWPLENWHSLWPRPIWALSSDNWGHLSENSC
jgi:hypothetical protein